jgi:hypothetical protein
MGVFVFHVRIKKIVLKLRKRYEITSEMRKEKKRVKSENENESKNENENDWPYNEIKEKINESLKVKKKITFLFILIKF